MDRQTWVEQHPYLRPIAELQTQVDAALSEVSLPPAPIPVWVEYAVDFQAGVPLLLSEASRITLDALGQSFRTFIEKLNVKTLPSTLSEDLRGLCKELDGTAEAPAKALRALLAPHDDQRTRYPGVLHYLGWTLVAQYVLPIEQEFRKWRGEDRWVLNYCPLCGSLPTMGQLVGSDPGRLRFLSCVCGARWRYRRTACPFCDAEDGHRLSAVTVEGDAYLRIDHCDSCGGYLKTYAGEGSEDLLLADWTSIHLDIIARDRGFRRMASSLFRVAA